MRLPTLLTAAGLLTLAAVGHTQVPAQTQPRDVNAEPKPITTPADPQKLIPSPAPLPSTPAYPYPTPSVPPVPKEPTVDELMDTLEKLQNQQAALAEQVQLVKGQIAKKASAQAERMKKLGLPQVELKTDVVPRTEPLKDTPGETLPIFQNVGPKR